MPLPLLERLLLYEKNLITGICSKILLQALIISGNLKIVFENTKIRRATTAKQCNLLL